MSDVVGVFECGQTVCEGRDFDTCQPHPDSGKICQPCRDFVEYCNSTRMPQGCNPYCLDQQRVEYEATFKNITNEHASLLGSLIAAKDNFKKEKEILQENITHAMQQIQILMMMIRNQTILLDRMQNENHNLFKIINKTEKSTEADVEHKDITLTMILVAVIPSMCTSSIVILVVFIRRRHIFKRKERSLNLQEGKSKCSRRYQTVRTKPTEPENDPNSKLITSCTTLEDTSLKRANPC